MKQKKRYFLVFLFVLLLIILPTAVRDLRLRIQQYELANSLDVNIKDYPNPSIFPIGYYLEVLQPGFPLDKVHQIVKGYKFVFHCYDEIEVYYFFNTDDKEAIRFMIFYDKQRKFDFLRGEDSNSNTIIGIESLEYSTSSCYEGLLE